MSTEFEVDKNEINEEAEVQEQIAMPEAEGESEAAAPTEEVTCEAEPSTEGVEIAETAEAEAEPEKEAEEEIEEEAEPVPVLKCTNLTKSYRRRVKVLDKLNLTIPQGKIIGMLGPNGCGKSTLMKLITGILSPDSGSIEICGIPRSEKTNSLVSYLPERTYFNSWMKVDALIKYFSDFYADFDEAIARKMFSDLGINTKAKLRTLSKGTKEKVQLVMVMSRRAMLYLLDEPIAGVDPAARDYIMRTIIGNYNPEATVIITTHLIYDIEPVLDEFYFMAPGGKIVLSGVCDDVRAAYGKSLDQLFKEVFRC